MWIVSTGSRANIENAMRYLGIGGPDADAPNGWVDGILSGADVPASKPAPDCFWRPCVERIAHHPKRSYSKIRPSGSKLPVEAAPAISMFASRTSRALSANGNALLDSPATANGALYHFFSAVSFAICVSASDFNFSACFSASETNLSPAFSAAILANVPFGAAASTNF